MFLKVKIGTVTGAGSGMGRAASVAMAREGAAVMLVGRRAEPLPRVKASIETAGGTAELYSADVSKREQLRAVIDNTVSHFGQFNLAFNNAGGHGSSNTSRPMT